MAGTCQYCDLYYLRLHQHFDSCRERNAHLYREREERSLKRAKVESEQKISMQQKIIDDQRRQIRKLQRDLAEKPTVVYNINVTNSVISREAQILEDFTRRAIRHIRTHGHEYRGYADGIKMIEFIKSTAAMESSVDEKVVLKSLYNEQVTVLIDDTADTDKVTDAIEDKSTKAEKLIKAAVVDNILMSEDERNRLINELD